MHVLSPLPWAVPHTSPAASPMLYIQPSAPGLENHLTVTWTFLLRAIKERSLLWQLQLLLQLIQAVKNHPWLHLTLLGRNREVFLQKNSSSPIPLWAELRAPVPRGDQTMLCTLPLLYHGLTREHQRCWSVKWDTYLWAPRGKQQRLISLKMLYSI